MTGALQRLLGVTIGVGVALLASRSMGPDPLSIAILVLLAQALGRWMRLTLLGTSQVVVSALLILTIGSTTGLGVGAARIAETLVGALVGVVVNALLIPPSQLPEAREAWRRLEQDLLEVVDMLANGLPAGLTREQAQAALEKARALRGRIDATEAALQRAETSLRFNYFGRRQREEVARLRCGLGALEHAATELRGIARVLADALARTLVAEIGPAWVRPAGVGGPLGRLLGTAGFALKGFCSDIGTGLRRGGIEGPDEPGAPATAACKDVIAAARFNVGALMGDGWVGAGSILADIDQLFVDLSTAAHAFDPNAATDAGQCVAPAEAAMRVEPTRPTPGPAAPHASVAPAAAPRRRARPRSPSRKTPVL